MTVCSFVLWQALELIKGIMWGVFSSMRGGQRSSEKTMHQWCLWTLKNLGGNVSATCRSPQHRTSLGTHRVAPNPPYVLHCFALQVQLGMTRLNANIVITDGKSLRQCWLGTENLAGDRSGSNEIHPFLNTACMGAFYADCCAVAPANAIDRFFRYVPSTGPPVPGAPYLYLWMKISLDSLTFIFGCVAWPKGHLIRARGPPTWSSSGTGSSGRSTPPMTSPLTSSTGGRSCNPTG